MHVLVFLHYFIVVSASYYIYSSMAQLVARRTSTLYGVRNWFDVHSANRYRKTYNNILLVLIIVNSEWH